MSHKPVESNILQERLRQARYSFNLALVATGLSASISLIGAGLLLSGKVAEGTFTAIGGMTASVQCIRFAREVNDRLDKTPVEIKDAD
ncbi:MAG: hypothetical protein RMY64_36640 [Nostoc sp. DedQUE08]|uniref:TRADD-N-associated membrane domain-containing protein n=1 Tax=Nostoc sp. DedQUE08 TaxID=3075393 RepID=UPI002AD246A3|nr:hypothetical protein [Nostoc sp. DedQUE08]MDZ8071090.1 hypothetical protein [Nostoc sp. DedQUE08]